MTRGEEVVALTVRLAGHMRARPLWRRLAKGVALFVAKLAKRLLGKEEV
ncbi:hypothetical protein [Pyramidobacter sp. C12-8]|nr:hypothetical protein [Pyramidobacter sp. C12-8]